MSDLRDFLKKNAIGERFTQFAVMTHFYPHGLKTANADFVEMIAKGELVQVEVRPLGIVYEMSAAFSEESSQQPSEEISAPITEKITLNGSHIEQVRDGDNCLIVRVSSAI